MLVPYLFVEARQSAHTKNQIGKLAPPNFDSEPLNSYEAIGQSFFLFNKTAFHTAFTVLCYTCLPLFKGW